MYSHSKIKARIEQLLPKYPLLGDHLSYPRARTRQVVSHLDSLVVKNDKGRVVEFRRHLEPDEQSWIQHERLLCALSYHHWAEHYHYIRHHSTLAMVPFVPNTYQQVLTGIQAGMEDEGRPVMVQLLKARQGGGTTDTTSKQEHRALFIPNTGGLVASSNPDKSWKITKMFSKSLDLQPWWLIPKDLKEYESGEYLWEIPSQNSYISVQHGNQTTGIVRGDTVNCYHLSEIPDWAVGGKLSTEDLIDAGLFGAWHVTPLHFGVMESTANGRHNFWHRRWEDNKRDYPQGLSLEQPVFLPYYLSPELYPTPAWLTAIPIPKNWNPPEFVLDHARQAQEYVRSNPLLLKLLGREWQMSREMMWWYHFSFTVADKKDRLDIFLSEYPASDTDAFQSKSRSVFPIRLVQTYRNRVRNPVGVFKLTGSDIPPELEPSADELLETPEDIQPQVVTNKSREGLLSWTLHPIKFLGYSATLNHFGILWVWEYPQENTDYCVSLDTSDGVGKDRTVLSVIRRGTPVRSSAIVARFSTPYLNGLQVIPIYLLLLNYYSTWSSHSGEVAKPLASPEMNKDGNGVVAELIKHGWVNVYVRRNFSARELDPEKRTQWGWLTTPASRPTVTSWWVRLVKGNFIDIMDYWTVDELPNFVANESEQTRKIRLEADRGAFDDHIMAGAIGVVTVHDLDLLNSETPNFRAVTESRQKLLAFPTYREQDGGHSVVRHPEDEFPTGRGQDLQKDFESAAMEQYATWDEHSQFRM